MGAIRRVLKVLFLATLIAGCGLQKHSSEAASVGAEFVRRFHEGNLDHVYYGTGSVFQRAVEIEAFRGFANEVRDRLGAHMSIEPIRSTCLYGQKNPVCEVQFRSRYSRGEATEVVTVEIALDRGRGVTEIWGYRIGDLVLRARPLLGDGRT